MTVVDRTYVGVDAVVQRYSGVHSRWSIYEMTRRFEIPHRKLDGTNKIIFLEAELDAWENGADLEVVHLPRGGRVVRPVNGGRA